jgi:hypothetical protein
MSSTKKTTTRASEPHQISAPIDSEKSLNPLIKSAAWLIYFIGGLNFVLGVVAVVLKPDLLKQLGIGSATIISGVIFFVLGYFVMKKSLVALIIAMAFVALSTVFYFVSVTRLGFQPNLYAVVIRIALLVPMYRAIAPLQTSARTSK